jgi:hypothetical protein
MSVVATRTRKGWDIALSVVFLLLAIVVGLVGAFLAFFSLIFLDAGLDAATNAQFAAMFAAGVIVIVGLIATVVRLRARRRGWWIAVLTLALTGIALGAGWLGYFTAVGWQ